MTDQEINTAIAKECGWRTSMDDSIGIPPRILPYCTDLNAIHEAEMAFDNVQWMKYEDVIEQITFRDAGKCAMRYWIHASARQRAEAFLRVKGLWKEGQNV